MISTKNLVFDISDVPREWVFEYYLTLGEKLTGQDVKMRSAFGVDKLPSMFVYYDVVSSSYKYKDFSSGYQGNHLDLVQKLHSLPNIGHAIVKVIDDYNEYLVDHKYKKLPDIKPHSKYKVTDFQIRHWTNIDAKYWTQFHITSEALEKYNVAPLEYYKMTKEDENGKSHTITIKTNSLYGYFRDDGMLYKIYQPKITAKKFIKVRDYIQGSEQLKYDVKYLIINSSLKDLLSFNSLNISNIETVAPDSENTTLPKIMINEYKEKYNKVIILFDNDEPGIRAMEKYKRVFDITPVLLPLEKDLSDSVKKYGIEKVRDVLMPLIKKAIYD